MAHTKHDWQPYVVTLDIPAREVHLWWECGIRGCTHTSKQVHKFRKPAAARSTGRKYKNVLDPSWFPMESGASDGTRQ